MKNSMDTTDLQGTKIRNLIQSRLIIALLFLTIITPSLAQDQRITLSLKDVTLRTFFTQIENQTSYRFSYRDADIDDRQDVDIKVKNASINETLGKVLPLKRLNYSIKGNKVQVTQMPKAKKKKISGVVKDVNGEPIIGANVMVQDGSAGTITDLDGNFSLTVPGDGILLVSYIGFLTEKLPVSTTTDFNIILREDAQTLDEIVVIGYGTANRQAITGSVAKAKLETYEKVPSNNILEVIKGSVPGLNVDATNSAGAVADFTVRGQNSTSGNKPLIVVDGAIFNGSLADIVSDDIESFTVLKDASAAAVYGSRSANGVVLIQTKRGRSHTDKPQFNVNLSYGISNELERLKLFDGPAYLKRVLDYRIANGMEADPSKIAMYLTAEEQKNYNATPDHRPSIPDPYDLFNQSAYNMKASVSISNSSKFANYYISALLTDQKGVILNDRYKNFSGRINIDSDLTDWLNVGVKANYSIRDMSGSSPEIKRVTRYSPYASIYDENGDYLQYPQTTTGFDSPFWTMTVGDYEKYNHLGAILTTEVKVPWVKGLSYQLVYSNNLRWSWKYYFNDDKTLTGQPKNGTGYRKTDNDYSMLVDNMIKYNNTFGKHNVDVTLLYSRERSTWDDNSLYAENFENMVLNHWALENGLTQTVNTGGGESGAIGMMARATYTFDSKYSLTGTIRRDGCSAFSVNKKWGTFGAGGFNWNISKEVFMKNVKFVDNLALRLSYGSNGNQSISSYSTLATVGTNKYIYAGDSSYSLTQYINSFALNDLGWETTTGFNGGVDFSLFGNRLSGSVDAYFTNTKDLLFNLSLPKISGKSSIKSNLGKINNRGVEINLHSVNIQNKNFHWFSDFAFSLNRNKVVTIYGEDNDSDGKEDDLISSGYFIGKSLGTIYDYKIEGMWQQENADNGTIMEGMRPGDYKIEDVNKDGQITSTDDRQFLGTSKENFRWSLTNTFEYKDFSLMVYINSVWGGNGYFLSKNTPYLDGYANRSDINHPAYDYWTPENTDAKYPRLDYNSNARYKASDYQDRSFIKLQKVSLSYNLSRFVKPIGINNMMLTLSADNLWTFAPHWDGLDPETAQGLTEGARPSIRTYALTLMFNF